MVLLVALGAGVWLAREQIGSVYDDLSDRIASDEALGATTHRSSPPGQRTHAEPAQSEAATQGYVRNSTR